MIEGCARCGVNPWTDCKHRKGEPRPDQPVLPDERGPGQTRHGNTGLGGIFTTPGAGMAFKSRKPR